jgi:Leucine-rich repeat (LRR) protein
MKNSISLLIVFFISFSIKAQIITIPDANFKGKLLSASTSNTIAQNAIGSSIKIDVNSDGQIQYFEALLVYTLNVGNSNINSLVGIANFTNLRHLNCYYNNLTYLPISNLSNLISLACYNNSISSLPEVENLVNLSFLNINSNPLTSINVSNLYLLESLFCGNTLVTQIDICGTKVKYLHCYSCPLLTTLNLKNNVVSPTAVYAPPPSIPPLFSFLLFETPLLNSICYDIGEYNTVIESLNNNTSGISFSTSCSSCSAPLIVNLKLNVQGYFDSSTNKMKSVKYNQDLSSPYNDVETINVELRNSLGTLFASKNTKLKVDGTAICSFNNLPSGSYYIGVKCANSVRTWSSSAQTIGTTPLTYDFTTSASKAFGNNLMQLSAGVFGFYSGDINNDGNIDNADYSAWEMDANNFASGYYSTDLNGDGNVDNADYSFWETNSNNFISTVTPFQ